MLGSLRVEIYKKGGVIALTAKAYNGRVILAWLDATVINSLFSQPRPSLCQSWCTDPHDRSCFDSWLSSPVLIESYYWNLVMEKHILQTNTSNSSNIVTYIFDPDPHVRPIMGPPACRSRFRRHMNRFLSQLERAGRYLSLGWIDGDGGTWGELHKWSLQPSSLSQVLGL